MGFIKGLLKFLGYAVGLIIVIAGVTLVAARFADGPMELIAGGPFSSGTPSPIPADWSFVKDLNTVEFQLEDPATSRTTWIMEHNDRIFIPCGYMDTAWGRLWKQWPIQAKDNPNVILRVDGKLYDLRLERIMEDPDLDAVLSELTRKYISNFAAPQSEQSQQVTPRQLIASESLWLFELVAR